MSGPVIRAAGGVLWRHSDAAAGGIEIGVIHRPQYDDWSLPKGKLGSSETHLDGAVREVLEETGFHVRVGRPLGESTYLKETAAGSRPKVIRWWSMQADEGTFTPTPEVDRLEWLSLADAAERVSRPTDRVVLERFARGPQPTRTVLLVRHASAGRRGSYPDDRERPLDECGVAQSDELTRILSRFEVGAVLSADLRRCRQTIEPMAAALGLKVVDEPRLAEAAYRGHEDGLIALVRQLGDMQHDAVACSQGEVIGDLLGRVAEQDDYPLSDRISVRKGSVWALSFTDAGRLVAADYLEVPAPSGCGDDSVS